MPGLYLPGLGNGIVPHSTATGANSFNPAPNRLTAPACLPDCGRTTLGCTDIRKGPLS